MIVTARMQHAVYHQALNFFANGGAVCTRLRAGNVGTDVDVGAGDTAWIIGQCKRNDVGWAAVIQVLAVDHSHCVRRDQRDRQFRKPDLFRLESELRQRFQSSGCDG